MSDLLSPSLANINAKPPKISSTVVTTAGSTWSAPTPYWAPSLTKTNKTIEIIVLLPSPGTLSNKDFLKNLDSIALYPLFKMYELVATLPAYRTIIPGLGRPKNIWE